MTLDIVKILTPATLAFFFGILLTPIITHYLYKYKAWKKQGGKRALDGSEAVEFNKLHKETDGNIPRMGGVVIWTSVALITFGMWFIAIVFQNEITEKLDFLSRNQTWIPLATLLIGAIVGLVNDIDDVRSRDGISIKYRLLIIGAVASAVGWWFYSKLDVTAISIPFNGDLYLGWLIIPMFVIVSLALYASGVIDGIDGLAGGVFATIFASYAGVAFFQNQIDLAAFCATLVGAILAFLWFNIPPARFYMTETGTMSLTITLAVVALMTDSVEGGVGVLLLPIIAFPLVITVLSNIIQVSSKKIFGRKVFKVAPIHHHFEAIGWPGYKVTMRFWIIGVIFAVLGMIVAFVG